MFISFESVGYNFQCDAKQLARSYESLECFKHYEMLLDIQNLFNEPRGGLSGLTKVTSKAHMLSNLVFTILATYVTLIWLDLFNIDMFASILNNILNTWHLLAQDDVQCPCSYTECRGSDMYSVFNIDSENIPSWQFFFFSHHFIIYNLPLWAGFASISYWYLSLILKKTNYLYLDKSENLGSWTKQDKTK